MEILGNVESRKQALEDEVHRVSEENKILNEVKISSSLSIKNLQDEILNLRETIEKVERRLKEFESAMQCLLKYLEGGVDVEGVTVFRFDGGFDWKRIHCLIKRECRRLEDGLPIYAYRSDILQEIHYQQVCLSFYCDFNSFYTLFFIGRDKCFISV